VAAPQAAPLPRGTGLGTIAELRFPIDKPGLLGG
jgi:hypothetical protein